MSAIFSLMIQKWSEGERQREKGTEREEEERKGEEGRRRERKGRKRVLIGHIRCRTSEINFVSLAKLFQTVSHTM